eukprot:scaffold840_cov257-Chaetoceros_neogracile.AAC.8
MAQSLATIFVDEANGNFYKRAFVVMTEPDVFKPTELSVLGPYKGGLRFHPAVDEKVPESLGLEQIFKNALTGSALLRCADSSFILLGWRKGGSDFDPKGKSENEVRHLCEAFITELSRYLGLSIDAPAGDIGVGSREIGFLYGQYKILSKKSDGVLTGKPLLLGGSEFRTEATGYGLIYITNSCVVSGSGNVAQYTAKKLIDLEAQVISMSDSNGSIIFNNGMTDSEWKTIIERKQTKRARLSSLSLSQTSGEYVPNLLPWKIRDLKLDYTFPCPTQNEINGQAAQRLIKMVQGESLKVPISQNLLKLDKYYATTRSFIFLIRLQMLEG